TPSAWSGLYQHSDGGGWHGTTQRLDKAQLGRQPSCVAGAAPWPFLWSFTMPRMQFTTQAMGLFTKSLLEGAKLGGVGSENLNAGLPDGATNLKVRDGVRKLTGGK